MFIYFVRLAVYYISLPDHTADGFNEDAHFRAFNNNNIIFNAAVQKSFCEKHVGCLSLKTVFDGEEWYTVNRVPVRVQKQHFLLLNQDQVYSSRIDSNDAVKSFSIFFKEDFSRSILSEISYNDEQLLDEPELQTSRVEFYQKLYPLDSVLQQKITDLINSFQIFGYSTFLADEKLTSILRHLVELHRNQRSSISKIDATKTTTRTELYRRLSTAKDVLHSLYNKDLHLEEVSRYAGMSAPQLIRQFKNLYGSTPHQYLTGVRMQKAKELLQYTTQTLSDITLDVGLSDASAFCRLFKKLYKLSPEGYRKAVS